MTARRNAVPHLSARLSFLGVAFFAFSCASGDAGAPSDAIASLPDVVDATGDAEPDVVEVADVASQDDGVEADVPASDDVLTGDDTSDDTRADTADEPDTNTVDGFVWVPDPDTTPLFDEATVKTLDLTFPPGEFKALLDCWRNPSADVLSGDEKCWFPCTATFDGQTSVESGCRPKGSPKKWNEQWKPQLIVRFDHVDDAGRFFGLRRMNLEASPDHAAPVRDQVGMWFMREAGLPAPRAVLLRVRIDGQEYGPYQSIEPVDKEFLSDHYEDAEGDLYDDDLDLVTNDKTSDGARLGVFLETGEDVAPGDVAAALTDLDALGDLDAFVRHLAAEACLGTVDNFSDGAGNTYFYDRLPTPGIAPIPWDLDDIFSSWADAEEPIGTCVGPKDFADSPQGVCEVLYAVPETRAAIVAAMTSYRDGVFPGLAAEVTAACAMARPVVALDPFTPFSLSDFDDDCAAILDAMEARRTWLIEAPELQ
ncbi:MAG: CotH kinase family protein [Myxococcales bacterium]|nr:CotH kinase family protein [Myxococcales bacterium]